jgi:hypothetical protein
MLAVFIRRFEREIFGQEPPRDKCLLPLLPAQF